MIRMQDAYLDVHESAELDLGWVMEAPMDYTLHWLVLSVESSPTQYGDSLRLPPTGDLTA